MPMYRDDRLPGGSHYIRRTTWEDEAAGAVVGGAVSAAGWLVGSAISGLRTAARNSNDRRLMRAVAALEEASHSDDDELFLARATSFVVTDALNAETVSRILYTNVDRASTLHTDEAKHYIRPGREFAVHAARYRQRNVVAAELLGAPPRRAHAGGPARELTLVTLH